MRKILLLAAFFGLVLPVSAQVTFIGVDGDWNDPNNWDCACVPSDASGPIIIDYFQICHVTTPVTADQLTVLGDGSLIIEGAGILTIANGAGVDLIQSPADPNSNSDAIVQIDNGGILILNDLAQFSSIQPFFLVNSGGEYRHNQNGSTIPAATWNTGSICRVTGIVSPGATPLADFRTSLNQSFYHFIYDCAGQIVANFSLEGALANVGGDLTIRNTNFPARRLTLGYVTAPPPLGGAMAVTGNVIVESRAKMAFGAAGTFAVNVGGDLILQHSSTSTTGAYNITNTGNTTVNVTGNLTMSNNGQLQTTQGAGAGIINVGGNFTMSGGQVSKAGAGAVTINFTAGNTHAYSFTGGTFDNVVVNYVVESGATLNMGTGGLGAANSIFTSDGTVVLGSFNAAGAVAGNIPCTTRNFNSGTIIYESTGGGQFMGTSQPSTANVATTINNASGVTLAGAATIGGNLTLQSGNLTVGNNTLTLAGNLTPNANTIVVASNSNLIINGSGAFGTLPLSGSTTINNFTVNRITTGTVTLGTDLTIGGTFTQTAGRVNLNNHTLTINAGYTGTGSLGTTASSNLIINGTGALPSMSFTTNPVNTLTLNRPSSTLASTGTLTATNLNLTDGGFSPSAFNMAAGGTITVVNGFISSTPGSSGMYDVVYNNPGNITGSAEIPSAIITNRLNNVSLIGGGDVILPNDCVINGNITITNGSLDAQTHLVTLVGNFIGNSGGALTTSTFTFDGNTTISGSSIPDFGNIILPSPRTLSLPATLNVAGDIQLTAGATLTHNSGTIVLTGTADQTIGGGGLTMNNLTANKAIGTDVILTSALNLLGRLSVQSTNTEFHSDGFLRLRSTSDAATGNARIGQLINGTSVTGDVIVERFMSTEGRIFRHVSAPVSGYSVGDLQAFGIPITGTFTGASTGCTGCTTNPSMLTYNVSGAAFAQFPLSTNTETMQPGAGYLLFIRQDVIGNLVNVNIPYEGPINQGDVLTNLVDNGTGASWNLVGNPYPSSIDWDIIAGWTRVNVSSGSLAVQDSPMGGYRYWNGSVGSGIGTGLDNGEIAKGQAFWVRTTGAAPSITIHEQAKTGVTAPFYKDGTSDPDFITINITDTRGLVDRAVIQVHEDATTALDDLDAPKLANTWLDLSTRIGANTRMAINAIDKISCETPIAIDMTFTKNANGTFVITPTGSYKFKFGVLGTQWAGRTVKLVDNYTNTTTDVTDGKEYSFSIVQATAATFAPTRFSLQFGDENPLLDLSLTGDEVACLNGQASLTIAGTQPGYQYYLANGTTPVSTTLDGNGSDLIFTVAATDLAAGPNNLTVFVKGMCSTKTLISSWGVSKQETQKPASADSQSCGAGKVSLTATGALTGDTYRWYESLAATDAIGSESIFVTPVLQESKIYYVSVRSQHGCESERTPVNVNVVNLASATIAVDNATLTSNFDTGNQWSFNDEPIEGATGKTYTPTESGVYKLTVSSGGCTTAATVTYTVTGDLTDAVNGVHVYPNPVADNLYVDVGNDVDGPVDISLQNELGSSVRNVSLSGSGSRSASISMRDLSGGIYFVKIAAAGTVKTIKVIKVSAN